MMCVCTPASSAAQDFSTVGDTIRTWSLCSVRPAAETGVGVIKPSTESVPSVWKSAVWSDASALTSLVVCKSLSLLPYSFRA